MDALLLYRSEDEASDSDQELDDARPLKRCKGCVWTCVLSNIML